MTYKMIPAGYMYKHIAQKPDWLKTQTVKNIYSVSGCVSDDFADYINYWKHNGYWLFNSPKVMKEIATIEQFSIEKCTLFYYEVYEFEYYEDEKSWSAFSPETSFVTEIISPTIKELCGYDVVNFYAKSSPECSLLSCNSIADNVEVNSHCLFRTFEEAKYHLEAETFKDCEPGPYRIFAVYKIS